MTPLGRALAAWLRANDRCTAAFNAFMACGRYGPTTVEERHARLTDLRRAERSERAAARRYQRALEAERARCEAAVQADQVAA